MKERPILFSGSMVRAILGGSKTQTRRVVNPPKGGNVIGWGGPAVAMIDMGVSDGRMNVTTLSCPYGKPGDSELWVRETFFAFGRWETRLNAKKGRDEWHFVDMTLESGNAYCYAADGSNPLPMRGKRDSGVTPGWWKRQAIFMPRAASRITLEITGVRVEKLQDISEEDAAAEGIEEKEPFFGCPCWKGYGADSDATFPDAPIGSYRSLWESINGLESWAANPFVWVVQFKVVKP